MNEYMEYLKQFAPKKANKELYNMCENCKEYHMRYKPCYQDVK